MAEKLDSYDFYANGGGRRGGSKYDRYMDGGIYRLVIGEDIPAVLHGRTILYAVAKKHGKKIRTHTEPDALVVQAYDPE